MTKFEHLATYVDSTMWTDDGVEQANPDYELETARCVRDCASSIVGKAVFSKIRTHGKVLIIPYTNYLANLFKGGTFNAFSLDDESSFSLNASRAQMGETPFHFNRINVVLFSPRRFSIVSSAERQAGFSASDVLLHELVHSGRTLGGDARSDRKLHGALAKYENDAEYFAVLVANIHISELNRPAPLGERPPTTAFPGVPRTNIRFGHGFDELPPSLTVSENFMRIPENYLQVARYCQQHPNIAPMIAKSPASFNPIQTYFEWLSDGLPWWMPPGFVRNVR